MTGGEVYPEACGFRLRPRAEVRDRVVLIPEAAGINKSTRGVLALLLADLPRREHLPPALTLPSIEHPP